MTKTDEKIIDSIYERFRLNNTNFRGNSAFFSLHKKEFREYKRQRDKELREILEMFNTHQIYEIREKIKEMIK